MDGMSGDMGKRGNLSRQRFERLVRRALGGLPKEFRIRLENVAVVIEDEPPEDMADTMGLYEGVPLNERSLEDFTLPDRITLFKGPIERTCGTEEELEAEVKLTVLHEVGHFFGLEETQLE
jgi:predicted Zn-dependent protease with MMP-like domain